MDNLKSRLIMWKSITIGLIGGFIIVLILNVHDSIIHDAEVNQLIEENDSLRLRNVEKDARIEWLEERIKTIEEEQE